MERLISWWARNPVASNLLLLGILLSGVLGFSIMEREVFPVFRTNQVQVEIAWPGAAPQEVEEQIIMRIEESLKNLDNIFHVYSTAQEGFAHIEIYTYPGENIEQFVSDIKMSVDSVNSLPRDIEKPRVRRVEYRGEMMRVAVHGFLEERELNRLAEDLRDEFAALPWVSIVELFGTRREAVTNEISEQALRR